MRDKIEKEILVLEERAKQLASQAREIVNVRDKAIASLNENVRLQIATNAQIAKLTELLAED